MLHEDCECEVVDVAECKRVSHHNPDTDYKSSTKLLLVHIPLHWRDTRRTRGVHCLTLGCCAPCKKLDAPLATLLLTDDSITRSDEHASCFWN